MHNAINKITSALTLAFILSICFSAALEAAELVYIHEHTPAVQYHHVDNNQ